MNNVHFATLDLNLLKVFMALLGRRSVTAAAADLALSPSAVSHALNRLRQALDDPLFERRAGGLAPTAYAIELGRRAGPALDQLRGAIAKSSFDAATAKREFVIAAGTYAASVLLPELLERVHSAAPNITLRIKRLDAHYLEDVERGRVDIALGVPKFSAQGMEWRPIVSDRVAWAARADHPFVHQPVTTQMLREARHVVLDRFQTLLSNEHDEALRLPDVGAQLSAAYAGVLSTDRSKPAVAIVSDMAQALELVRRSDFVTLTLRRFALAQKLPDIAVLDSPRREGAIEIGVLHHPARLHDGGLQFLLDSIVLPGGPT